MHDISVRAVRRLRDHGFRGSLAYLRHLVSERHNEMRLGIKTAGSVPLTRLGIHDRDCKPYAPTAYRTFRSLMRHITVRPEDVFLDYGAGKGRVVVLASQLPFRRVIGVEISPGLSEIARQNVKDVEPRLGDRSVEIVTQNAACYPVPDDVTVVHFFDPFKNEILRAVVDQLRGSLLRAPRTMTILYADAQHFEPIVSESDWIVRRGSVPFPYAEEGLPSIRYEYRIYQARLPVAATTPSPLRIRETDLAPVPV